MIKKKKKERKTPSNVSTARPESMEPSRPQCINDLKVTVLLLLALVVVVVVVLLLLLLTGILA